LSLELSLVPALVLSLLSLLSLRVRFRSMRSRDSLVGGRAEPAPVDGFFAGAGDILSCVCSSILIAMSSPSDYTILT
jgi:hypothetical protein